MLMKLEHHHATALRSLTREQRYLMLVMVLPLAGVLFAPQTQTLSSVVIRSSNAKVDQVALLQERQRRLTEVLVQGWAFDDPPFKIIQSSTNHQVRTSLVATFSSAVQPVSQQSPTFKRLTDHQEIVGDSYVTPYSLRGPPHVA